MSDTVFEAIQVSRSFDLSRPLLRRLLPGARPPILQAVAEVSFAITRGTTMALVGESGCGKTTLARLATGLDSPSRGEIRLLGHTLLARSQAAPRRVGMVFQDTTGSLDPRWRVRDIVAEPLRATGIRGRDARRRVDALLTQVGLAPADGERYPHTFSGGQRQRIAIARALGSEPAFLVCDEPTSALDVSVQAQILNLVSDLQQRMGLTMLLISHNLAVVRHMADALAVMYLGRLVEHGPAEAIFVQPRHPYTQMLLDAVPRLPRSPPATQSVATPPAEPPSRDIGCAFHPRCSFANARCRVERPAYTVVGAVRVACHAVAEGRK